MAAVGIKAISFSHEALINWLIMNPDRPMRDAAAYFGYTQAWLSTIVHSDIFQAKLSDRQDEVFANVASDLPAKLRAATDLALSGLTEKLETTGDAKFLLDATDKLLHRMGYAPASARNPVGVTQVNNTQINNTYSVCADDLAQARALAKARAPAPLLIEAAPQDVHGSSEV